MLFAVCVVCVGVVAVGVSVCGGVCCGGGVVGVFWVVGLGVGGALVCLYACVFVCLVVCVYIVYCLLDWCVLDLVVCWCGWWFCGCVFVSVSTIPNAPFLACVRRSAYSPQHTEKAAKPLQLLAYKDHFCYIKNVDRLGHAFACSKCKKTLEKQV